MRERVSRSLLAGVLAMVFGAGCGSSSSGGPNRGSQCTELMQAYCSRAGGDCALFPADQISACVQSGVSACCNGNCSAPVVSTESSISICVSDIDNASCSSLDVENGGTLPASCEGVVISTAAAGQLRPVTSSLPAHIGALLSR